MTDVADVPDYRARFDLAGRGYIVFGAGQGIGRQTAHALHQCGATVVCVDSDEGRAAQVAAAVGGIPVVADVTQPASVRAAFETALAGLGRLDGVVDIIGGSRGAFLEDVDEAGTAAELALNLTQALTVAKEAVPLLSHGGSLTFVGSVAGLAAIPRQAVYGAAKAGLHHLVRSLAAESGYRGIRINVVAPGFVETPRMAERFSADDWSELAAATPLQRVGRTDEIAAAILFLASDLASFVTGHVLVADGGVTIPLRVRQEPSRAQLAGEGRP